LREKGEFEARNLLQGFEQSLGSMESENVVAYLHALLARDELTTARLGALSGKRIMLLSGGSSAGVAAIAPKAPDRIGDGVDLFERLGRAATVSWIPFEDQGHLLTEECGALLLKPVVSFVESLLGAR
jgi:hypothetical protein